MLLLTQHSFNKQLLYKLYEELVEFNEKIIQVYQKLGSRDEPNSPQRRNSDYQKAHKMFHIINYLGDANQNCNVISLYSPENGTHEEQE